MPWDLHLLDVGELLKAKNTIIAFRQKVNEAAPDA